MTSLEIQAQCRQDRNRMLTIAALLFGGGIILLTIAVAPWPAWWGGI